jgi:membrane protein DedA with SNARE-associated domain
VGWWTTLGSAVERFFEQYGLAAAFVLIAIEEAGVPSPLPADLLVLLASIQARAGRVSLWQLIAVAEVATVVGASGLYFLARWAGRDAVYRYGHYVRATPDRLDRVEARLRDASVWNVALGRVFPGLRVLTAVACGVFDVPFRIFLPGMAIGALAYLAIFALVGYVFGPPVVAALDAVDVPIGSLLSLGLVALVLTGLVRASRGLPTAPPAAGAGRFRAGALAGLLAAVSAALVFNVLAGLVGVLTDLAPAALNQETVRSFARDQQRLIPILASLAALVLAGAGVGGVYGWWGERAVRIVGRSDAAHGLTFALIPWAVTIAALPRLMDLTAPETIGLVVVQTVQYAAFGLVLGLAYPVFRSWLVTLAAARRAHAPAIAAEPPSA